MNFDGLNPFSSEYRERLRRLVALVDALANRQQWGTDPGDQTTWAKVFPATIVESQHFPPGALSQMQGGNTLAGDQWFYRFIEVCIQNPWSRGAIAAAAGRGGGIGFEASEYQTQNPMRDPGGWFKELAGGRTGWALNGLEAGNTLDGSHYGTGNPYMQGLSTVEVLPVGANGATVPVVLMLELDLATDVERPASATDQEWDAMLELLSVQYVFCAPNPIKATCAETGGAPITGGGFMFA